MFHVSACLLQLYKRTILLHNLGNCSCFFSQTLGVSKEKEAPLLLQPPETFAFLQFFMPPKELWEAYSNRTVRPSVRQSVRPSRFRVRSISPIFFEVGIPNLVCGYILRWRSAAYHFRVTVTLTLTFDLVFRIIVSGAYLLYYLRWESQIWCVDASWDDEVSRTIIGSQ